MIVQRHLFQRQKQNTLKIWTGDPYMKGTRNMCRKRRRISREGQLNNNKENMQKILRHMLMLLIELTWARALRKSYQTFPRIKHSILNWKSLMYKNILQAFKITKLKRIIIFKKELSRKNNNFKRIVHSSQELMKSQRK